MPTVFSDYFRCPDGFGEFGVTGDLSPEGFFQFGGATCYGRAGDGRDRSADADAEADDLSDLFRFDGTRVLLPFDLSEVVTNLRQERYAQKPQRLLQRITSANSIQSLYYLLRPMLPVSARKYLQRARLNGWHRIPFPRWPVDFTVETLMERAMALVLASHGRSSVPFIWYWPAGLRSCAIMTHDVEDREGRDFCGTLMDINESHGIKAAFQIIPENRYDVSPAFLESLRRRGFEVNVHDLNHDGRLFQSRHQFLQRSARINRYAKEFGSRGFRAGAMYRRQEWFDALDFSYDMSVPNVAHLEPQRGGCCTVMPYYVGGLLELPLTTIQDYSLFHILGDYSTALWQQQIDLIMSRNGLISFIAHPDYLEEPQARSVYVDLLAHLRGLIDGGQIWMALPSEVERWWRSRHQMKLVRKNGTWCIEGPDSHRARVAYASLENGRVIYTVDAARGEARREFLPKSAVQS